MKLYSSLSDIEWTKKNQIHNYFVMEMFVCCLLVEFSHVYMLVTSNDFSSQSSFILVHS